MRLRRISSSPESAFVAVARLALLVAILVGWQLSSGRVVGERFVSSPIAIADRFWEWARDGTLWSNLWVTVRAGLTGYVFGSAGGIFLGVVLGRRRYLASVFDPYLSAIYALPKVALAPLFIVWFGIGSMPKIVLTGVLVFFLVFYNTFNGVRSLDEDLVGSVRIMGATRAAVFLKLVIPNSLPWILAGLRLAAPYAIVGAVVGELIVSSRGLGFLLEQASMSFDSAGVFVVLFVVVAFTTVLSMALQVVENRVLRWKHSRTPGRSVTTTAAPSAAGGV